MVRQLAVTLGLALATNFILLSALKPLAARLAGPQPPVALSAEKIGAWTHTMLHPLVPVPRIFLGRTR
jgi:hypothetical protein